MNARLIVIIALLLSVTMVGVSSASSPSQQQVQAQDCPSPQPYPVGETYVERQPEFKQSPLHWTAKFVSTCGESEFWDNGPVQRRTTGPGEWENFRTSEEVSGVTIRDPKTGNEYWFCSIENPDFNGEVFEGVINPNDDEMREPRCDLDRPRKLTGEGKWLPFTPGDSVAGAVVMFMDSNFEVQTRYGCYLHESAYPGFVFNGVINPLEAEKNLDHC